MPAMLNEMPNVRDLAISPQGDEIYFTVESFDKGYSYIAFIKRKGGGDWTEPEVAPFSGNFRDMEPAFSPDGFRLFFASNRPLPGGTEGKDDFDIWFVERKQLENSRWDRPESFAAVNTGANEFYPSMAFSGNLYFTSDREEATGKEDIFISEKAEGEYKRPVRLGDNINSENYEFNAFIDPEESFIVFSSYGRENGLGGGDLYFSVKDDLHQWQPAVRLGEGINSSSLDFSPFIDLKNRVLYFTSNRSKVKQSYPERMAFKDYQKDMKQFSNGLGRIYRAPLESLDYEQLAKDQGVD